MKSANARGLAFGSALLVLQQLEANLEGLNNSNRFVGYIQLTILILIRGNQNDSVGKVLFRLLNQTPTPRFART